MGAEEMHWRDRAMCLDVEPEVFYPAALRPGARSHNNEALKLCGMCPVKAECLDWAYEINDQWAVLGGLTVRQRAKTRAAYLRKKAKAA